MITKPKKNKTRLRKHKRVRKKVKGNLDRPRLNIYRSLKNMYAQIIDDTTGNTLVSASTHDESLKGNLKSGSNKEAARKVGELIAQRASDKGIENVVFDRGGYLYHGRVKELAEGAREEGLK